MASAKVVLRKKSNPASRVQAELSLNTAPTTRVKSRLGKAVQELHFLDGAVHPSHVAAEAAAYSGSLFALRKLNAIHGPCRRGEKRYTLVLDRLSGVYQPEDNEGFAHAGLIAVAQLTGRTEIITADARENWELESCDLTL